MGDASIPWKPRNHKNESYLFNADANMDDDEADRLKKILDAKYDPANLDKIVAESGLKPEQKIGLLRLLQRFEELFDGALGTFNMEPYNIELAEGAKPYHLKRPYKFHKPI